ncbi:DUF4252 domain-containing protein [Hyunsoonleella sp. SJ7]|uniref:DUF4252 domain-containing protein n=1 Tax=Hyunsoonleella aquatilis TaxID=2762758 RepID=A0A923HFW4_9FLAO|nr:DUF4252 domain-containing protein [Hyunsoonleella aquatilis]MBC3757697.1 DUF4252 domain-containing protein [Hyunsoonleella aquatilis]
MNRATKIFAILLLCAVMFNCKSEPSLQRYFVDNQETTDFISQDIPISMLELDETKLTEEQKEAYKSVRRLNFIGFKADEKNQDTYSTKLEEVKDILRQEQYQDLMEFQDRGNKFVIKYVGDDDEADEVIVLGSSKEVGFGVVRLLGDDMKPEKMYALVEAMRHSGMDASQFKEMTDFFK